MPVDLTPGNQLTRLREAATSLRAERDTLREQVGDVPKLYDELAERDEKIARLEARGIEDLLATIEVYRAALARIVAKRGRGALRIATEALTE